MPETPDEGGWNLLAALEAVIGRLLREPQINFQMLKELEEMRDELQEELHEEARRATDELQNAPRPS